MDHRDTDAIVPETHQLPATSRPLGNAEHIGRYNNTEVVPMSAEEILALIPSGSCSSVFLDGKKLARSVFVGMLKTELGLPIKHPQWVRLDE